MQKIQNLRKIFILIILFATEIIHIAASYQFLKNGII